MDSSATSASSARSRLPLRSRDTRFIFVIFFFIYLINYLDRYIFTGASNIVAKDLGMTLDQVGYVSSAFLIVYTLCILPLGFLADRIQRKTVVAICVTIWSLATALTSLANGFISLFLSRMILGLGEAGYLPAGTAVLSDAFTRARRARVMSYWNIAQYVGILCGFIAGGYLAGVGQWRLAFLLVALPGLLLAFLTLRIREPYPNQAEEEAAALADSATVVAREEKPKQTLRSMLSDWIAVLRIPTLVVVIVIQIFAFFVLSVAALYLPIYLQQKDTFALSSGSAALYAGVLVVLGGFVGSLLGGFLADLLERWFSGARVIASGLGFLFASPMLVLSLHMTNLVLFLLFAFLTVLGLAVYNGPLTAASQDVVPAHLRSSSFALALLLSHLLGDAFAPTIVGVLATWIDPTHGGHFRTGVAGADLALMISSTCGPALLIAGLVGIFCSRWMSRDVAAAEHINRELASAPNV